MTRSPSLPRDGGFTLIELLIAILAVGILLPAIAATFYMGLRTTDDTNKRILDSHDVQAAAAYVSVDVENATSFATNDTTTTCKASAYPVDKPVLRLSWTDQSTTPGVPNTANYYVSGTQLVRARCVGLGSPSGLVVMHSLDPTTLASAWCPPAGDCSGTPAQVAIRGETVTGQFFSLSGTRRAN